MNFLLLLCLRDGTNSFVFLPAYRFYGKNNVKDSLYKNFSALYYTLS